MTSLPAWLTALTLVLGAVGTAGFGGIIKASLDHKRGVRKQSDDVAMALVNKLDARVDVLEKNLAAERANCEAQLGAHRHRINNLRTTIYSLLHLFDVPSARRKQMLDAIRTDIATMEATEATEKAIIVTAGIRDGAE